MDLLSAHLAQRMLTAADGGAWLFPAPHEGPLGYAGWHHRIWAPARRRAGIDGQTFHGLRHTATNSWIALSIGRKTAQHRLGHSTPRLVLELHAHVVSAAAHQVGERLFGTTGTYASRRHAP